MATKKPGSTSRSKQPAAPLVGVIMGSDSDFGTMKLAADALAEFDIPHEVRVVSAHRTPDDMAEYGRGAAARGLKIVLAGAGGAAPRPGLGASHTAVPGLGVPTAPGGIGNGRNAGLLAVRMLAAHDAKLRARYEAWMRAQAEVSRKKNDKLVDLLRQG